MKQRPPQHCIGRAWSVAKEGITLGRFKLGSGLHNHAMKNKNENCIKLNAMTNFKFRALFRAYNQSNLESKKKIISTWPKRVKGIMQSVSSGPVWPIQSSWDSLILSRSGLVHFHMINIIQPGYGFVYCIHAKCIMEPGYRNIILIPPVFLGRHWCLYLLPQ